MKNMRTMAGCASALALTWALLPAGAAAQDQRQGSIERANALYEQGQVAIERAQWNRAVERFSTLVSTKSPRADAAMYWRAYALDKMNRQADTLTTVADLVKTYPSSRWLADARALEIQVRQRAGQPISPDLQADEDLKLFAIQGLQRSDPEQAVPLLEKLLQEAQSPRLKERVLFVLAQSNAPRARLALTGVARGGANPDLQLKAIQYLGMLRLPANRPLLDEIYASSQDVVIKGQILRGFAMGGDRARVVAAATSEPSPELRGEAVRHLGRLGARDQMWQLYQKETDLDVKESIIQGIFMSGDLTRLVEIAGGDANTEMRRHALQHLGMMGQPRTGTTLLTLYTRQTETALKEAAIDALFIQQNADALVSLARKEPDRDLKRRIVQRLSLMRAPAARDYLTELLK